MEVVKHFLCAARFFMLNYIINVDERTKRVRNDEPYPVDLLLDLTMHFRVARFCDFVILFIR